MPPSNISPDFGTAYVIVTMEGLTHLNTNAGKEIDLKLLFKVTTCFTSCFVYSNNHDTYILVILDG